MAASQEKTHRMSHAPSQVRRHPLTASASSLSSSMHGHKSGAPTHRGARTRSPEQKSTFLRLYFLLAMLYGLLGFLHSLLIRNDPQLSTYPVFTETVGILSFVFVLFSVAALVFFWQYRFATLVFVLPWYYVVFQTILIVINYMPFLRSVVGLSFQAGIAHTVFTAIGIATSLFEFFFAFYVIERLRLFG